MRLLLILNCLLLSTALAVPGRLLSRHFLSITNLSTKTAYTTASRSSEPARHSAVADKLLTMRGGSFDELANLDWRYFAAGGICAATSHGITTPIDVIKTKMQTDPEKYNKGMVHAARSIVAEEGVSFLLAGLAPTVVGYGIEGALKFGFYESFKILFKHLTSSMFVNYLMASIVAGAVASVVLCPMEETRIKMVGDASWAKENLLSGLLRLMRETGILATFGGLPAMLSKQIPYTMGKQVSFDLFAKLLYTAVGPLASQADPLRHRQLQIAISFLASASASVVACVCSQPGDMILTATYKGGHGHNHHKVPESGDDLKDKSFGSVVRGIYKRRGLKGFYVGLEARLAHVAAIITSQLMLYDAVKMALGLPITGSH